MPILFHAPMACSLAVRFAAAEGAVPLDVRLVRLQSKELEDGGSLYEANPLGLVSTLRLDDGQLLTENTAILTWVQSQSSDEDFRRDPHDASYFQMLRWIAFVSTELHKQLLRVVFYNEATDAVKDNFRALAPSRYEAIAAQLGDAPYLLGEHFSAADAYLAWYFALAERARIAPVDHPSLMAYQERTWSRPKISNLLASDRAKRGLTA